MIASVGPPSTLDPRGPAAADIAVLWWVMLAAGVAVLVLVCVLLARALRSPAGAGGSTRGVVALGIVMPAIVLAGVLALTIRAGALTYWPGQEPAVAVDVVGHKFWWEVRYPQDDGEVVTANELHIPAGEPVLLRLHSEDVIHSFWVPQLHGKMDMVPGTVNEFWIEADEAGTYRGICAEYCGLQHAQMHFLVVAEDDFDAWLAEQAAPAPEPDTATTQQGAEVFADLNCAGCHDVRGIDESGTRRGPDLTHFGSRRTIAAGMQPNDREHLAAWLLDPHETKPGVRMPPTAMEEDELDALLAFLESLE